MTPSAGSSPSAPPPDAVVLKVLTEATQLLNSTRNTRSVLRQIVQFAANLMQAEAASVLRHDVRRGQLIFEAAAGQTSTSLVGESFDAGLGIAGRVLKERRIILVDDVSADPAFYPGIDARSHFQTRQVLAAPLIGEQGVLGVVEVLNRRGGGTFDERDRQLLEVFANLAACALRKATDHEMLQREHEGLKAALQTPVDMIGRDHGLAEVVQLAQRVAPTLSTVLLLGETGTGKEVLARYIHAASPRRDRIFIGVNCAALSETLLESELFGHEKGAFTGAVAQRPGRFEIAEGGSLFLDEIGDISQALQVKLLRVLQEREFVRVGGTRTIGCDVRILAATNRDLKTQVESGAFREDLYYRLNVFPIRLPPLRERVQDVPELAEHFVRKSCRDLGTAPKFLSPDAVICLSAYGWPGNIRELANVIERAVLMSDGESIEPRHFPSDLVSGAMDGSTGNRFEGIERSMVLRALRECNWNQTQAARKLGISRDHLRYRLKKYDIRRP